MTYIFNIRCDEKTLSIGSPRLVLAKAGIKHPWTNRQIERMNRTIKEATVKRYHYDSHRQLEAHLQAERFNLKPTHQMPGLNT
jgi:hypothetical protein